MLCILLTDLDAKGENEKGKNNRENKAKWQRDDKVSLEHTQNIRLPTRVFICIYKYQITDQTVSTLPLGSPCLHRSRVTVVTPSLPRQEGKEAWHRKLVFNGKVNHIRFSESSHELAVHLVFALLMFII